MFTDVLHSRVIDPAHFCHPRKIKKFSKSENKEIPDTRINKRGERTPAPDLDSKSFSLNNYIFSHVADVLPKKIDFTLKMLCMHHIIPNRHIHLSGGFYSWLSAPDRGGNRTTKLCLGTYLTILDSTLICFRVCCCCCCYVYIQVYLWHFSARWSWIVRCQARQWAHLGKWSLREMLS
jgi:hypothetical protein